MAGFLDKKSRVLDVVLTDYGKELFSKAELEFSYYSFSDSEVDYDPYIYNSGSLSTTDLTASKIEQIENTVVREAVFGLPKDIGYRGLDRTNISSTIFSMPQGQKIIPKMKIAPDVLSGTINVTQQMLQTVQIVKDQNGNVINKSRPNTIGYRKFNDTTLTFDLSVEDFNDSSEGFQVSIFESGSDGLTEVKNKRDLQNVISFLDDLRLFIDNKSDRSKDSDSKVLQALTKNIITENK